MKKILFLAVFSLIMVSCNQKGKSELGLDKFYSGLAAQVEGATSASSLFGTFKSHYENGDLFYNVDNLKDGSYEGRSGKDNFGYEHVINFDVKDGRIVNVKYDEIKGDKGKKTDEDYWKNMGKNLLETYGNYENQLVEKQDMRELDQVAGASYSLYRMRLAFSKALE